MYLDLVERWIWRTTGRTLDQDRLVQPRGQEDDRRKPLIRYVALSGEPLPYVFNALKQKNSFSNSLSPNVDGSGYICTRSRLICHARV